MALTSGAEGSFSKTIGEIDIHGYAGLSGDQQPIHVSAAFASRTSHGIRIVHEAFLVAMMGAAASRLAVEHDTIDMLPIAIDVRFDGSVCLGETVIARVRVVDILPSGAVTLQSACETEGGTRVAEGQITLSNAMGAEEWAHATC